MDESFQSPVFKPLVSGEPLRPLESLTLSRSLEKLNYAQLLHAYVAFPVQPWKGVCTAGWWQPPGQRQVLLILSALCCPFSILILGWALTPRKQLLDTCRPHTSTLPLLGRLLLLLPQMPQKGRFKPHFWAQLLARRISGECWNLWSAVRLALVGGSTVCSFFVGTAQKM